VIRFWRPTVVKQTMRVFDARAPFGIFEKSPMPRLLLSRLPHVALVHAEGAVVVDTTCRSLRASPFTELS